MKSYLQSLPNPAVLEIGIDEGVTFVVLQYFLSHLPQPSLLVGVDVKMTERFSIIESNLEVKQQQQVVVLEANSLEVLPKMAKMDRKFDLILIDGDHNYYTVSKELEHLNDIVTKNAVIIIDDYSGRWSEKDLWYAERDTHSDVKITTVRVDTEKHGVKAAVDEFLTRSTEWLSEQPIKGEPIVLRHK